MKKTQTIGIIIVMLLMAGIVASFSMAKANKMMNAAYVLTAEQAHDRMQSGDELIVLDVRSPEEYAEKHVAGALLLPLDQIGDTKPEILPDQDAEILVYCRSGNRSAKAAQQLRALGYTKVYDFGGIKDWTYETESGSAN